GGRRIIKQKTQFLGACFHLVEQSHVLDCDDGLIGERRDEVDLLLTEWIKQSSGQKQYTNRRAVAHEWNRSHGPINTTRTCLKEREAWIREDVWRVNGPALKYCDAGDGGPINEHRIRLKVRCEFGGQAIGCNEMEPTILQAQNSRLIGATQSCC